MKQAQTSKLRERNTIIADVDKTQMEVCVQHDES